MNTDPENASNEVEANIPSGITRRSFIKRTTATVVVTVLALHAFRLDAFAEADGSASWKPAIEITDHPISATITSTPFTTTYNSKVYTMTMVTTISPFPFVPTQVITPDGKAWKKVYREVSVTCSIGVTVTSLGGVPIFSRSYENFSKVLSAGFDLATGKLTGSAMTKTPIPDIDFGNDLVLRISYTCSDGNVEGRDSVSPMVTIFPAFFVKEPEEGTGEHSPGGPSTASVRAEFEQFLMKK